MDDEFKDQKQIEKMVLHNLQKQSHRNTANRYCIHIYLLYSLIELFRVTQTTRQSVISPFKVVKVLVKHYST